MSPTMLWNNVVAYSLQVGLLVALAAIVPAILGLKMARAKLLYWHLLLAAILLLPLVRPPEPHVITGRVEVTTTITAIVQQPKSSMPHISTTEAALLLLAAGAFARLIWLGVGLWRLSRYRRQSDPLVPATSWGAEADLRISPEVSSPVTFGFRKPVVLLPPQFPSLEAAKQDAILCHEVLHVRRHDWLFTLAEEFVRAVFWFHPAIWWLLGEIQLAREQAVDREVIEMTKASDEYVDALLAIAGAHPKLDLAPAPLFLRKRHLKQRVVSILKEVRMSKTRWMTALAAAVALLAGACWFVTGAFPLLAAPQMVTDAAGVSVEMGGAQLMHRSPVMYPSEALRNKIEGTVVLQVKLDSKGEVSDATVLSGPDELRKTAIQSVLNWHFVRESANSTRQVSITFQLPKEGTTAPAVGVVGGVVGGVPGGVSTGVSGGVLGGVLSSVPTTTARVAIPPTVAANHAKVRNIQVIGLSDQVRSELLSKLPIREGDQMTPELMTKLHETVNEFDPHLMVGTGRVSGDETDVIIRGPFTGPVGGVFTGSVAAPANITPPPGTITVGGNQQQTKLVQQPHPIYPPLAKQARIQGVVRLNAIIGKDGHVQNLSVLMGHPLLVQAALDAVKDWVYEPTLLNGDAVPVMTVIDVNFTLSQ